MSVIVALMLSFFPAAGREFIKPDEVQLPKIYWEKKK